MRLNGYTIFLAAACLVIGLWSAIRPRIPQRCFVMIEKTDMTELSGALSKIRRIGKEARNVSDLKADLKAVGEVKVLKFTTHIVICVKIGNGDMSALDQQIRVNSFTGSPVGLLNRIAKESGTVWSCPTFSPKASQLNRTAHEKDLLTRITIEGYRGSIREILAQYIPPSYSSLAMSISCNKNGTVEVRHYGWNQSDTDQFAADRIIGSLPKAEIITDEERELEGGNLLRRK